MHPLRTIVERLSRGLIFRRRLPADVGGLSLFVSPDSQLKYLKRGPEAFDAKLLFAAREYVREDSVVWDIGANVGVFTFAGAGIAAKGRVLAVEADPWLAELLRRSCRMVRNREFRIDVVSAAIASRNGVSSFAIASRGRASSHLAEVDGATQSGGARSSLYVPTLTLDTLLEHFPAPTVLKIDIEGAELLALQGAERLLREARPAILVEVCANNLSPVTTLLHSAGYAIFDGTRPLAHQEQLPAAVWDTLAVPA